MALIRWEPATELNTLQNEMNRLFNTFFDQPAPAGRGGAPSRRWVPAMDLVETADHYVLEITGPTSPELRFLLVASAAALDIALKQDDTGGWGFGGLDLGDLIP